jgi:hypothetical protein
LSGAELSDSSVDAIEAIPSLKRLTITRLVGSESDYLRLERQLKRRDVEFNCPRAYTPEGFFFKGLPDW